LESVASGTSKRVREWVIKGLIIMRFGTECKVFLEMDEIRKVKLYFVFCRFNVARVYTLLSTVCQQREVTSFGAVK
jgi:hypothetical protein